MALNLWKYNGYDAAEKYTLHENQYAGRVLKISRGESYQIMSDIWGSADWALVLNEENKPERICLNIYDMGAPEHVSTGEVDATEEVKSLYCDFLTQRHFDSLVQDAEDRAMEFEKGSIAQVVRGKTSKGMQGKVVVMISAPYRMGYRAVQKRKLGIATSDVMIKKPLSNGKVVDAHKDMIWVWAMNCQRLDKPQIDRDALLKQARDRALRDCAA
jgi:hypothetical protein